MSISLGGFVAQSPCNWWHLPNGEKMRNDDVTKCTMCFFFSLDGFRWFLGCLIFNYSILFPFCVVASVLFPLFCAVFFPWEKMNHCQAARGWTPEPRRYGADHRHGPRIARLRWCYGGPGWENHVSIMGKWMGNYMEIPYQCFISFIDLGPPYSFHIWFIYLMIINHYGSLIWVKYTEPCDRSPELW